MSKATCDSVFPVFREYEGELLNFLKSRLKSTEESQHLLTDVLLKVYDHCDKLADVKNMRAWLFQVTRNALTDHFRQQNKHKLADLDIEPESQTTEDLYHALAPLVPLMIRMLPSKYSKPLLMSDVYGKPQKEIAEKLGISYSGAKSRIQRGREMLKDLFHKCTYLELDRSGVPISFAVKEHCTPLHAYQPAGEVLLQSKEDCNSC